MMYLKIKNRELLIVFAVALMASTLYGVVDDSYDAGAEFSLTANPNGYWLSYAITRVYRIGCSRKIM